jgi:voltage-gated potassium channel
MEFMLTFLHLFALGVLLASPLLVLFACAITALGQVVGRMEGWSRFNSLYWSFITALTVGYGDIRPTRKASKVLSVCIGLLGIMMTGLIVAITVASATLAFEQHVKPKVKQRMDPQKRKEVEAELGGDDVSRLDSAAFLTAPARWPGPRSRHFRGMKGDFGGGGRSVERSAAGYAVLVQPVEQFADAAHRHCQAGVSAAVI